MKKKIIKVECIKTTWASRKSYHRKLEKLLNQYYNQGWQLEGLTDVIGFWITVVLSKEEEI